MNQLRKITSAAAIGLALALVAAQPCLAKPKAVVIVTDAISIDDLLRAGTTGLGALSDHISVGLMSTKTEADTVPESGYISIGAGARARSVEDAAYAAANADELFENRLAKDVFASRTGTTLPAKGVGALDIAGLIAANTDPQLEKLRTVPGGIGTALHGAGLRTGVLGNSDTPDMPRRQVATIAMDSRGVVDLGDVSTGLLRPDPMSPAGFSTDYDALLERASSVIRSVDFCAIDLGDTSRIEHLALKVTPTQLERYRVKVIQTNINFVAKIAGLLDLEKDILLVVSPSPSSEAMINGDKLTPIFAIGAGFDSGLVTSPSTRWPGIVSNADVAATVLARLDVPQIDGMVGRAIASSVDRTSLGSRLALMSHENADAVLRNKQRATVLRVLNTIAIAILVAFASISLIWKRLSNSALGALESWGVYLTCAPLALIIHAALPITGMALTIPIILVMTWALGLLFRKACGEPYRAVIAVAWCTVALVVGDLWLGQSLNRHSLLSYNPVEAARFYGIGNELAGTVIGATIVAAVAFTGLDKPRRRAVLPVGLLCTVTLASVALPGVGAEFGSTLPALVALGYLLASIWGWRPSRRLAFLGAVAALALLAGMVALDLHRGDQASHVGRLVRGVQTGGLKELYYVIVRKLGVNIKLIRKTIWSRLLIALLLPWIVGAWKGSLLRSKGSPAVVRLLAIASAIAAVGVLVLNDSGVVAACTLLLFPTGLVVTLVRKYLTVE